MRRDVMRLAVTAVTKASGVNGKSTERICKKEETVRGRDGGEGQGRKAGRWMKRWFR
jgi:hypothetical protein